jgi:putative component of toxin-antitoxin plasmid stabilization module
VVYLLIAGGDKATQTRDIARAIAVWRDVKSEE